MIIDPKVTKQDIEFLQMTPEDRYQHLIRQGHAFPTREQCTDEGVAEWFDDLGAIGQERLRLATVPQRPVALTAPPSTPFGEEITSRQRLVQAEKLLKAMALLKIAVAEAYSATPDEISQTVDVALEIITKVNMFLKSRYSK